MISYKFPEEKEFILFFSEKMGDQSLVSLLESTVPITQNEAKRISIFSWSMIDLAVALQQDEECPWPEGYEFWSEKVLQSITAFLKKSGYDRVLSAASNHEG